MNVITSINQPTYPLKKTQQQNEIQFKGLNIQKFLSKSNKAKKEFLDITTQYSFMLNKNPEELLGIVKGATQSRLKFFDEVVSRYNGRNYYLSNELKEDSQHVLDIFSAVKNPTKAHYEIINNQRCSMKTMNRIFKGINDNAQKADMANEALQVLRANACDTKKVNYNLVADLLESQHADKYAKDFETYKPYIILNKENPNAIKDLDKLVTNQTYNFSNVKKELAAKECFENPFMEPTAILNPTSFKENYSEEGGKFIDVFFNRYGFSQEGLKAGNDKEIFEMYKSTNKNNVGLRTTIIDGYFEKRFHNINSKEYNPEIKEMQKLFDKVEQDKDAASFVTKLIKDKSQPQTIKELNAIIDNIPNRKLNVFYSNTKNIIEQTSGEKTINVLKTDIENPFYESDLRKMMREDNQRNKFMIGDTPFQKVGKYFVNQFNKLVYMFSSDSKLVKPIQKPIAKEIAKEFVKPELGAKTTDLLVSKSPFNEFVACVKQPTNQQLIPVTLKLKQVPSKTVNTKKLQIINDVNNIIEKKLGVKTLEQQKRDYAIKATKIRMSLLPEIFKSIKDTRQVDRLVGKTKIMSSNKDALDLYERINGKNKKLVNYMLKKRNVDGTRLYEVKDIINTLDKAESRIIKMKKSNPDFKAQDVKTYYDKLLDIQIQQNGKLPRTMKQS